MTLTLTTDQHLYSTPGLTTNLTFTQTGTQVRTFTLTLTLTITITPTLPLTLTKVAGQMLEMVWRREQLETLIKVAQAKLTHASVRVRVRG